MQAKKVGAGGSPTNGGIGGEPRRVLDVGITSNVASLTWEGDLKQGGEEKSSTSKGGRGVRDGEARQAEGRGFWSTAGSVCVWHDSFVMSNWRPPRT